MIQLSEHRTPSNNLARLTTTETFLSTHYGGK